jgi:trehalose 6-phosphate phosphatase
MESGSPVARPYSRPVDVGPLLAPLTGVPERSAILLDVDGTLAPIAARPELSEVPPETKAELRRLVSKYLLVGCVSGRSSADAARLVGVEGVRIVGNHGLELDPRSAELAEAVRRFVSALAIPDGLHGADKGLSVTLHYREAADPEGAEHWLAEVAAGALEEGLDPRWGRMVLEIRPAVSADKGTAVRALIAESVATRALYAGDDITDLDAFAGLESDELECAVRVAVASAEGPSELTERADLVVESPAAFAQLLRLL